MHLVEHEMINLYLHSSCQVSQTFDVSAHRQEEPNALAGSEEFYGSSSQNLT